MLVSPLIDPLLLVVNEFEPIHMPFGLGPIHHAMHLMRDLRGQHMVQLNLVHLL
jgi:hypothetical protein